MVGRPTSFNQKVAEEICERLLRGEPLARICDDKKMPGYTTVRRWEDENADFRALSARARIDGTHYMADDCIKIADDPGLDPADKRVRIDTRIRLIGKWNSKVYGEKTQTEHSGPNGAPIAVQSTPDLSKLTKEQRDALRSILGQAFGGPESDVAAT